MKLCYLCVCLYSSQGLTSDLDSVTQIKYLFIYPHVQFVCVLVYDVIYGPFPVCQCHTGIGLVAAVNRDLLHLNLNSKAVVKDVQLF